MARILLVDDDATTLDLIGRALAADRHQVKRCSDGQEALQELLAAPDAFDLLLTDVDMPGVHGIELARRTAEVAPRVRILMMSGFDGETDQASLALVASFITKPVSLARVRAAVRAALA